MQKHYGARSKHCEWCGSNFVVIKGRQSDMCAICFTRLKEYQSAQQLVVKATKQLEEVKKCLIDIESQYKELAKQGFKIPEGLK